MNRYQLVGNAGTPYLSRKLKPPDPLAMPIHLTHEYLTRSNNNHCKGTEIFVRNLLLDGGPGNVRLKLLPDASRFLIYTPFLAEVITISIVLQFPKVLLHLLLITADDI